MKCFKNLIAALAIVLTATSARATLIVGTDNKILFTGGDLLIQNEIADSGFANYIYLRTPSAGDQFLFVDSRTKKLTFSESKLASFGIAKGDELEFLIKPDNGKNPENNRLQFSTGSTTRNIDQQDHVELTKAGSGAYHVNFEDSFLGGDKDFNDAKFLVKSRPASTNGQGGSTNSHAALIDVPVPTANVADPTTTAHESVIDLPAPTPDILEPTANIHASIIDLPVPDVPKPTANIPEPSTLGLLLVGLIGFTRRKIR